MNETIAGIILVIVIFGTVLLFSDDVQPDLRVDDPGQTRGVGHPLWNE